MLRSQVGGIVGLRLVNTNRAQFEVGGGLMVNDERGVDTDPTQNLEGLLTLRSSFYTYDRPKTTFSGSVQYYPNLTTWGRQRLQVDSNIKREVWGYLLLVQRVRHLRQRAAESRRRSQRRGRRDLD